MEVDPSKAVGILERLFGPKLGRFVAIILVSLACLAFALWLTNVIWTNGGEQAYKFFHDITPPNVSLVTLDNVEAIISTLVLMTALFGTVLVAILYFSGRALFKKSVSQSALDGLARLRSEGINNVYTMKVSNSSDLTEWRRRYKDWEQRVLEHVKRNFPESDLLSLQDLGLVIPIDFPGIQFDADHQTQLSFFAKRVGIIEQLLTSYRR